MYHKAFSICRIAFLCLIFVGSASAQEPLGSAEEAISSAHRDLKRKFGHFDWDRQRPNIERALENIWAENKWTDESDRFAFEVARDTSAIPPWQVNKRLDLAISRYSDRYELSSTDKELFRRKTMLELGGFLGRNAASLFQQMSENFQSRERSEPYTPEQIGRAHV